MANKIVREIIHAKGIDIGIYTKDFENEYISLTDIAKYRNDNDPRFVIQNWMHMAHPNGRVCGAKRPKCEAERSHHL